jgi:hypothetical protein
MGQVSSEDGVRQKKAVDDASLHNMGGFRD